MSNDDPQPRAANVAEFANGGELELVTAGGGWPPGFLKVKTSHPDHDTKSGIYFREGVRRPSVEECLIVIRELREGGGMKDDALRKEAMKEVYRSLLVLLGGKIPGDDELLPLVDEACDDDAEF